MKRKYAIVEISIIFVVLLVPSSLSRAAGYQAVQSSDENTVNTYYDVDM